MKFIVSSIQLLKSLQSISGVLNASNTLPILDDFLFDLKGDQLVITASDLDTTVRVNVPLSRAEEEGAVTIPARILMETLKTFPEVPLQFTIDTTSKVVEIMAGEGKFKLAGHNAEEFPQTPVMEETSTVVVASEVIAKAISKTIFATGTDDFRQAMTGVFCQWSPEDLVFVGTDAHKLVRYRRTDAKSDNAASFILPKKPLNQLKNLLSHTESDVTVEYNQANAAFSFENIHLVCRLIDGRYPNYEAVIPKENPNKLLVERIPFLNSLKRVAIYANQSTHQVRVKVTGQEMVLSAEDIDFANEAKERLNCHYEGEDMEIGFNSKFLVEMVSNLDTNEITLEMSEPNRAGILLPVNNENPSEDILMLVMPVMLAQY
ncbi:MAG TPA: DNA polymerase III subunit beta [Bacteroidales bacterium]|nr:DNA polymerase III subunit beta [Bacteroidales bacterium]HSA43210.1 DNA polymerase III subunit beta [Bacteroidales bacterium]